MQTLAVARRAPLLCILIYFTATSGCSALLPPGPQDLNLTSVRLFDLDYVVPRTRKQNVAINFSSGTDLAAYAHDHVFSINASVSLCAKDGKSSSMIYKYESVYWNGNEISPYMDASKNSEANSTRDMPRVYSVYIPVNQDEHMSPVYGDPPIPAYDLRRNPEDLCLYLHGGDAFGRYFTSNSLVVPKTTLALALSAVH